MSANNSTKKLSHAAAISLFIVSLVSFVAETQLTQYTQTTLGFRQPYFIFYVVHSSFAIIFPLHFLYLVLIEKQSPRGLIYGLSNAITEHMSPAPAQSSLFPTRKFIALGIILAVVYSAPSLLWFIAINFASVSDVTAIWNTNAFWAYIFTVKVYHLDWEPRRLMAVLLATAGVLIVVYGGNTSSGLVSTGPKAASPVTGDLLTLAASVIYGIYQVMYKKHVTLKTTTKSALDDSYDPLPVEEAMAVGEGEAVIDQAVTPPPGLHANLLTSIIGFFTFVLLWLPIPLLDYFNIEPFILPGTAHTYLTIAGIAATGVLFNAGFMILLGIWGPVITSVGNLLTIILVLISDLVLGGTTDTITVWSVVGSGAIVSAFAVLAYEMSRVE